MLNSRLVYIFCNTKGRVGQKRNLGKMKNNKVVSVLPSSLRLQKP